MPERLIYDEGAILRSLLEVGVNISVVKDRREMLEMVLREARALTNAEAGMFYVADGDGLDAVAFQNDALSSERIQSLLSEAELSPSEDSLAAFAVRSGKLVNIPDTYELPAGSPFRIHRELDASLGYKVQSVLTIPLTCPDGSCVGVLQLINCTGADGDIVAFPDGDCGGVTSLAAMAAVTVQNLKLQEQLREAHLDCIIRLSVAAEFRDDDTAEHVRRISHTSKLIAEATGLNHEEVELIEHASPMHDVGKIGIPDAILNKPGPLTFEERNIVEKHALIGADILSDPPNELIAMAREVALTHHERWDGKGYPGGMAGEQIPVCGRIVAMADVFDALVSKRCYKEAFALEIALEIVRFEEGKHFAPEVVEAFFSALPEILKRYEGMLQG